MHLCPSNSFAETSGQNNPQGIPHLFLCFQTVNIQCYDGAPAPVQTQQTFLAQHTVRFIYGMHINADFICQLAYRWESISFMILLRGNAVYNLIAKLDIQCLVTVKINLYCHL